MVRAIAFYLPQYHPIPENDLWWGAGFTEWVNVARSRRRYPTHYQPRIPGELGFYDLRVAETRAAQAELAKEHGLYAFCYWHYWFAGKRLLERPFNEVLASGEPDFPFCLGWGNQSWTGIWHGDPHRLLIEQHYPGLDDHRRHFDAVMPAFADPRYVTVDGKPIFLIQKPHQIPEVERFVDEWRNRARAAGLRDIFFVGRTSDLAPTLAPGVMDAWVATRLPGLRWGKREYVGRVARNAFGVPRVVGYDHFMELLPPALVPGVLSYPCVIPDWDNTARSGRRGLVLHGASPRLFRQSLRIARAAVEDRDAEHQLIFVMSWNEWAEGNYLEPDRRFGRAYLEAMAAEICVQHSPPRERGC